MKEQEKNLIFFKIKGFSMQPFFKTGDMFIVKKTDVEDIKIGDIISYYSEKPKVGVCHRLIKKVCCSNVYFLYARGDACVESLEVVEEKALFGKVIGVIRNGRIKSFSSTYQSFVNRGIVIFLPIFLRIYNRIKSSINKTVSLRRNGKGVQHI